jgi:deoxycytidine triphosphate deaminase
MLMNSEEIQAAGVIQDASADMYQAASYNLRVGRIILPGGQEEEAYQVQPLGMVKVVSWERLELPKNVLGYATVKTGLSKISEVPPTII